MHNKIVDQDNAGKSEKVCSNQRIFYGGGGPRSTVFELALDMKNFRTQSKGIKWEAMSLGQIGRMSNRNY